MQKKFNAYSIIALYIKFKHKELIFFTNLDNKTQSSLKNKNWVVIYFIDQSLFLSL